MNDSIIDQQNFLAWLEAQPEGAIVGLACVACDCPLTRWLKACGLNVSVLSMELVLLDVVESKGRFVKLPEWAAWFTLTVDLLGPRKECQREDMIIIVKGIKTDEKKRTKGRN